MPFYRFNGFTGRLQPSTDFQPLYPISPKPLESVQEPAMFFDSVKTKPVTNTPSTRSVGNIDPNLVKKMEKYNAVRNVPVYRAGGTVDRILFGLTLAVLGLGTIEAARFLYRKSMTK